MWLRVLTAEQHNTTHNKHFTFAILKYFLLSQFESQQKKRNQFQGRLLVKMLNLSRKYTFILLILAFVVIYIAATKDNENDKPAWAKKKITDYSDADMERLLDQWNVSDFVVVDDLNFYFICIAFK